MTGLSRAQRSTLGVTATVLVVSIVLWFVWPDYRAFLQDGWQILQSGDHRQISNWFESFGVWGPILIVALMIAQMVLFVVPSWLAMIVASLAYGLWWGTALSVGGVALAASLAYLIGDAVSGTTLDRLVSPEGRKRLAGWIERYGIGAVILFRVTPFLSNDAISFAAGVVRMGFWRFLFATLVGIVPLALAVGWFAEELDRLRSGLLWVGGVGLVVYGVFIVVDRARRSGEESTTQSGS